MIKIIWNAFLLGVITLCAAWLSNHAGYVEMEWIGYRIQTSVAVLIGAGVLLYFIFHYCLVTPVSIVASAVSARFASDARAERIAKGKVARAMDRYVLLAAGMTALESGDVAAAENMQKQIHKKFEDDRYKTALFDARLAEEQGKLPEALDLYAKLSQNPETRLFGMRGVVRLNRLTGDTAQALEACTSLLDEKNPPVWVISEAFELQAHEKRWDAALATLEKGRKRGVFDKPTARRLKACILLEQSECAGDPEVRERLIREAADTDSSLIQAVLSAAECDIGRGNLRKARSVLKDLWKKSPCFAVYEMYQASFPDATPLDAVRNVEELISVAPDAALNGLVLADASFKAHLWGQAKTEVEKYLQSFPDSKRGLVLAGDIAEACRDEKAAAEYRERAAVQSDVSYRCSVCGTDFSRWHTVCPVCHTLGSSSFPV